MLLKCFRISTSSKEVGGETKRNSKSSTWRKKEHECAGMLFIVLRPRVHVYMCFIYLPSPLVHSVWRDVHAYVFVMNDCISRMFLLHILFLKSVHYLIMWPLLGRFLCMYVLFVDQYVMICTGNVELFIHYLYFCTILQCIMYRC